MKMPRMYPAAVIALLWNASAIASKKTGAKRGTVAKLPKWVLSATVGNIRILLCGMHDDAYSWLCFCDSFTDLLTIASS